MGLCERNCVYAVIFWLREGAAKFAFAFTQFFYRHSKHAKFSLWILYS